MKMFERVFIQMLVCLLVVFQFKIKDAIAHYETSFQFVYWQIRRSLKTMIEAQYQMIVEGSAAGKQQHLYMNIWKAICILYMCVYI